MYLRYFILWTILRMWFVLPLFYIVNNTWNVVCIDVISCGEQYLELVCIDVISCCEQYLECGMYRGYLML